MISKLFERIYKIRLEEMVDEAENPPIKIFNYRTEEYLNTDLNSFELILRKNNFDPKNCKFGVWDNLQNQFIPISYIDLQKKKKAADTISRSSFNQKTIPSWKKL